MASVLDLPPELMLMVTSYLDGQDILNLQLTNKRLKSLSTNALCYVFFSERAFHLSPNGLEQLYALSVHGHARHVKTIIIRVKIQSKTTAKYLTLLDRAFRNFAKHGNLTSIGVRRDESVAHTQHFDIAKRSHAVMRDFLLTRMIPAANKARLLIKSIIYDFVMPKDQIGSDRPLTCQIKPFKTPYLYREEPETARSIEELPNVVPKHLEIVVRFVSLEQPASESPSARLSQQHDTLALVNTSIYHHDNLTGWLHDRSITSLSFDGCDLDATDIFASLSLNPLQSLSIVNAHQYRDHNTRSSDVWKRQMKSCTPNAWIRVFETAQELHDLTYLRLGQLWVGTDEQYVKYSYEAQGQKRVSELLRQLSSHELPSRDFLLDGQRLS